MRAVYHCNGLKVVGVFEFGSKSSHHIRLCHVVTVDHYKVNRFYPQGFFLCFKRNIFTLEIEVCSHKPSSLQRAPDQTFPELFLCSILFPYLIWSSLYKWNWSKDWGSAWTLVLFLPPLAVDPCQAMLLPWSGTWNDVIRVQGHCVVRWLEAPFKWGLWSKLPSEASLFFLLFSLLVYLKEVTEARKAIYKIVRSLLLQLRKWFWVHPMVLVWYVNKASNIFFFYSLLFAWEIFT